MQFTVQQPGNDYNRNIEGMNGKAILGELGSSRNPPLMPSVILKFLMYSAGCEKVRTKNSKIPPQLGYTMDLVPGRAPVTDINMNLKIFHKTTTTPLMAVGVGLLCCTLSAQGDETVIEDEITAEVQANDIAATTGDIYPSDEPEQVSSRPTQVLAKALPKAENVDLEEPVIAIPPPQASTSEEMPEPPAEPQDKPEVAPEEAVLAESLVLLGKQVQPGIATRLSWSPSQSFEGIAIPTPVLVAHGSKPGPVLCLTASIHGDELNGIEIVRRVLYNIKVDKLWGTVIGVPIVNLQGFHRASRYLADRRDLNRFFPGNPEGSSASRIAHSFFNQVIKHCNALVDLHTGSFHRTNLPQLRADLTKPQVVELTHGFGATVVLHSEGARGTLRNAAVAAGIPAVTLEAGGPMQLQEDAVAHGVKGIQTLLNRLGMYKKISFWGDPEPVYYESIWIRAQQGGILLSEVKLGKQVKQGDLLGVITNPITNVKSELVSPYNGKVLGKAVNQVVQPGFAAFRIGIQREEKNLVPAEDKPGELNAPPTIPPAGSPTVEEEPDLAKAEIPATESDSSSTEDSE